MGEADRLKSRLYSREIAVRNAQGDRSHIRIDEKQVVFYGADCDRKAKADREPIVMKARDLVNHPGRYHRATSYGAAKCVKQLVFDPHTGGIVGLRCGETARGRKFDGYYVIVISEWQRAATRKSWKSTAGSGRRSPN